MSGKITIAGKEGNLSIAGKKITGISSVVEFSSFQVKDTSLTLIVDGITIPVSRAEIISETDDVTSYRFISFDDETIATFGLLRGSESDLKLRENIDSRKEF